MVAIGRFQLIEHYQLNDWIRLSAFHLQQPAGVVLSIAKAIEQEISQTVDDRLSTIGFGVLGHMRMSAHYRICADVNH